MRVVFLGNHTVGVAALSELVSRAKVVGVVAHPNDPEDGVVYQSVYDYAKNRNLPVIRGKAAERSVADFIVKAMPDLIWIADYRYLIPADLLSIATLGAVNLHPSLLPRYRGRAPINWAIIEGDTELGLTAHFIDEGMDSGDIIEQVRFELSIYEDVGDALRKLLPLYTSVTGRILRNLQTGKVFRQKQDNSRATYYPARKPKDGQINWGQSAGAIVNLIRAVATPYPGAFAFLRGIKILIWKASVAHRCLRGHVGLVIGFEHGAPIVACGEGAVVLRVVEVADTCSCPIELGDRFTMRG